MNNEITLRDYFSAKCMPESAGHLWGDHVLKIMAENAYAMADSMLEARKTKK